MGRYDRMMIVSDLDGTFLGSCGRVVPRNVDAVRAFCDGGGLFTFATGRHYEHLPQVLPDVAQLVNMPVILANGACLYDYTTGKVIAQEFMDEALGREMLIFAREHHERVGFRVTTPQGFLTDGRTDIMQRFVEKSMQRHHRVEVARVEDWSQKLWYKVVFRGASEDLDVLAAELRTRFDGAFEYNKSSETFFEVQKQGCSKGKMLQFLKSRYEEQHGQEIKTYGVGDYENDLALLQEADVAVCPSNAHPSVKAISQWCLCDNDHGVVADLIEKL